MTDPFDFISTRLEEPKIIQDVREYNLLPSVPADYRSFDTTQPQSLIEQIAQGVAQLPDNKPAYSYLTQQENRYSNPNLQYTPYNIFGTDTEDIYGRNQSKWNQLGNALVKTGANIVGTFASSFLTVPSTLDLIRSGKPIEAFKEDHLFSSVQNWLTALEDKYPNYYTEWEREHPYISGLPFSGGAMNFWGDKVIKNIGFSVGALSAGLVQDSLIELATAGTATPASFIAAANQLNKFKSNLFRGFRNLTKGADNVDDIINASKITGNLAKGLEVSRLSQVGTAARFAGISYLNAQGESFIEGYHTYLDTKKQLLEQAINEGNTDPHTLAKIEQLSQDAGRYTTGLNIPILTLSNLVQFPNLLYGKSMLGKEIGKQFLKYELGEQGIKAVSDFTLKKGLKEWALNSLKSAASEGLEEGAQFHISNSLHDYYVDRMNPKIKESLGEYIINNVPKSLSNKQFWEESFLGALSGMMMGAPATLPGVIKGKERYDDIASKLNNSLERFNSTVNQFAKTIELNNPNADKEVTKHDTLFSAIHDSLKFGTFDTFIDSLEDLKEINLQQFNQAFKTEFETEEEKNSHVNNMIYEGYGMRQDILKVNRFFPTNPYTESYLTRKIKNAFSPKNETELNSIQENLFDDFKEVVARNESLLRKTKGEILKHKNNLKQLGVKNESIEYLANLSRSPKGLKTYLDFKQAQIKDLERQAEYYSSLSQSDVNLTPELNPKQELKKVQKILSDTQKYIDTVTELYSKLEADPKNQNYQREVLEKVILEETDEDQRDSFIEEKKKIQQELEKATHQEKKLEIEKEDLHTDTQTKEQLIELNQQAQEQGEILREPTPVPEPIVTENQWLNKFNPGQKVQIKGNWYTIVSKDSDSLIVTDSLGVKHIAKKTNNKWDLKSVGPEGVINQSESTEPIAEIPSEDLSRTEEVVDEYLSGPDNSSVVETIIPTLTLNQEEFTADEIINYPNTVWTNEKNGLADGTIVYTIEEDGVRKRKLYGSNDLQIGEASKVFNGTLKGTFKQILREGETVVTRTKQKEKNTDLSKFLGEYSSMKEIFQQQIDNGKFELIC